MATYTITGGGVAFQDIDPEMPGIDEINQMRRYGYNSNMIRDWLRREGFEDREIERTIAQSGVSPQNQSPRFYNPSADPEGPVAFDSGTPSGGRAATPGHSDQILAERGAMRELQGGAAPTANEDQWNAYMQRVTQGQAAPEFQEGFLGGFPTDFVYRTENVGGYGGPRGQGPSGMPTDNTGSGAGRGVTQYSRPTYREGGAYQYMSRIGESKIREWQTFFAGLGFKTGPAGLINSNDVRNMQAFMGMANGIPGGMTVDVLRGQVMDQARNGTYFFRGVNESGDLLPLLLDEDPAGDLLESGGGAPGSQGTQPITRTRTRTVNQELSSDQGMLALRQVMQQQTGRAPTDDEVNEYVRQVNAAFRADPTVMTETQTFDPVTQEETTETVEDETDVSPEGQALTFSQETSPEERKQFLTGRYIDQINSMLGM